MLNSKAPAKNALSHVKHKYSLKAFALSGLLAMPTFSAQAAGFSFLSVPDPGHKNIEVGVWYPSDAAAPSSANTPFNQALAIDASISGEQLPLVVISHGYGGWMGGHADAAIALADAGFVVAATSHTGNTFKDMSSTAGEWIFDRPRHISKSIDYLQQQWSQRQALQLDKVGVFGFSAGGMTALSLIGAVPNVQKAQQHCDNSPEEFVCKDGLLSELLQAKPQDLPLEAWGMDPRIKAAVLAAPGFAFAYDQQSFSDNNVPVQLWSGLMDDRVPHASNSAPLAQAMGAHVEMHEVKKAGHFSFMVQSCTEKLKKFEPDTWDFICVDQEGFDRWKFHDHMNTEMLRFFKQSLQ